MLTPQVAKKNWRNEGECEKGSDSLAGARRSIWWAVATDSKDKTKGMDSMAGRGKGMGFFLKLKEEENRDRNRSLLDLEEEEGERVD